MIRIKKASKLKNVKIGDQLWDVEMMKKFFTPILIALIIIINMGRFIALEESPPGFYIDESAGATQIICLRETGSDPDGKSFPVFRRAAGFLDSNER